MILLVAAADNLTGKEGPSPSSNSIFGQSSRCFNNHLSLSIIVYGTTPHINIVEDSVSFSFNSYTPTFCIHHSSFFSLSTIFFLKNHFFFGVFFIDSVVLGFGFRPHKTETLIGWGKERPFYQKMRVVEDHKMGDLRDQFPVGMRVLAVDDDRTCLMILETLLQRCQYHGNIYMLFFLLFDSFGLDIIIRIMEW